MKISDILPTSEQLSGIQGIEKSLLQRRRNATWWSSAFVIAGAVLQAALLFRSYFGLTKLSTSFQITVFALFLIAASVYFTLRYTSFLFKESKEPFRYTFNICAFSRIDGTPGDRFKLAKEDTLKLLHYDLMERLNRRIGRLSLLDDSATNTAKGQDLELKTHIHVEGEYAIREEKDMGWVLQVMPRVRIGPATNPFTLAFCVRYPLAKSGRSAELSVEQYEQLTERVHSSIATEIYRQIKTDVENKLSMFPTNYLRAVARYVEARDFENSNTIDSYDRALELYQKALDAFDVSVAQQVRLWLAQQSGFRGWSWARSSLRAEARARLGYARCMVYRRIVSEITGRSQNAIYELRGHLSAARDLVTRCYNSVIQSEELMLPLEEPDSNPSIERAALLGMLEFPDDKAFEPHLADTYRALREELAEIYAVSALGYSRLSDIKRAESFLKQAEALNPATDSNKALVLLAKSSFGFDLQQKLSLLRRASELAQDSEIISYQLAVSLDLLARLKEEINPEQVKVLRSAYERVLRINPGNVACLIGQGYLSWLVEDLDAAENAFRVADDLKDMVSQTFVGDLMYGRARVAAERAAANFVKSMDNDLTMERRQFALESALEQIELARQSFVNAVEADPAVAASYNASVYVRNTYYELIGDSMLHRYFRFQERLEIACCETGKIGLENDSLRLVRTYALNDFGNACLSYYLRCELLYERSGTKKNLLKAIEALEKASIAIPSGAKNVVAAYNLAVAFSWRQAPGDDQLQLDSLNTVVRRFPTWLEAVRMRSKAWATIARVKLDSTATSLSEATKKLDLAKQQLNKAEERLEQATKKAQDPKQEPIAEQAIPVVLASGPVPTPGLTNKTKDSKPAVAKEQDLVGEVEVLKKEAEEADKETHMARVIRDGTVEDLTKEAQAIVQGILDNSLLGSFKDDLSLKGDITSRIESLLNRADAQWDRLADREVAVLGAWADVVAAMPDPDADKGAPYLNASVLLCRHLLSYYSPEEFTTVQLVVQSLLQLKDSTGKVPQGMKADDYQPALERTLSNAENDNPKSHLLQYLRVSNSYIRALYDPNRRGDAFESEGRYEKAAEEYEKACGVCPEEAYYHSKLADMREKLELNLLESGSPGAGEQTPQKLRTQAIAEFVTASALDSDSAKEDYQARIISLQSRDWNIAQGIYARLNTYSFIDLIEIQVSESMIQDLFNADSSLKEGLQKNISDLRQDMIAELGVTLPRVTFRDNKAFAAGQFGVYVCGIPYASGTSTDSTPEDKWTILTDSLRTAAASHMAEYFGPQDAVKIIKDAAKDQPDFSTLLADPQALADATIVLRGLLSEGVSVKSANLPLILSTVLTGRSAGSDLLSMQEHIRCSNPVRPELPGNEGVTRRFLRLGSQLDAGISLCIDTSWGQPFLNPNVQQAMGLVNQIYTALGPVAGSGQAALLTSVKTRPFVRLLTQPSFPAVPVLSDREILLPLLAQVQSEI